MAAVIQGSVLGPILFLLYIPDINEYLPAGAYHPNYADDILAYSTFIDIIDDHTILIILILYFYLILLLIVIMQFTS